MPAGTRRGWVTAGWIVAVVATALNGVVVGYGAIWFQLFGETADAEDYRVSAGGYGAAAVVLIFAVVGILTHRAPRWLASAAAVAAVVLAILAISSLASAADAKESSLPINGVWDGVGGVLWAPWTWALVGLAVHGLYRLVRTRQ